MTLTVSEEDLVKMHLKQLNPQMSAMQCKLMIKPFDIPLVINLSRLLGRSRLNRSFGTPVFFAHQFLGQRCVPR
jgi:hypothetical protein